MCVACRLLTNGLTYFVEKENLLNAAERIRAEDRRHNWAPTHVTGAYGIIGVLVGLMIDYLLGVR